MHNRMMLTGRARILAVCLAFAMGLVVGTPVLASADELLPEMPTLEDEGFLIPEGEGEADETTVSDDSSPSFVEPEGESDCSGDGTDADVPQLQDGLTTKGDEAVMAPEDVDESLEQEESGPAISQDVPESTSDNSNAQSESEALTESADEAETTSVTVDTEACQATLTQSSTTAETPSTVSAKSTTDAKAAVNKTTSSKATAQVASSTTKASTTKKDKKTTVDKKPLSKTSTSSRAATTKTVTVPLNAFALETGLSYGSVGDVKGGSSLNRTNIQLWRSNNSNAQRWRLERHGAGYYVVNVKTGKVLDIAGGTAKKGTNVQLYSKNGSKAQLWMPVRQKNGGWVLKSLLGGGLVLDVSGGSSKNGANLQVWTANGSKAQTFWMRETNPELERQARTIDDGAYLIVSSGVSQVLDTRGGTLASGVNIQLHSSNGTNAQRFWATYADGYYTFQNTATGLALDVEKGSPVAGSNVRLYKTNHSAGQQWSVVANKDGSFRLINRAGGLSLDVAGGKRTNGSNIQGYYRNSSVAQAWTFRPTSILSDGTYLITGVGNSDQALDASGGGTKDGSAIRRVDSTRGMGQRFRVRNVGDDTVEVRSVASGLWVSDRGTSVVQSATKDSWKLVWGGSGLTLSNGTRRIGFTAANRATTQPSKNATRLSFEKTTLVAPGYYGIESLVGNSLDVQGSSRSRANAQMGAKASSQSQAWYFTSLGSDRYIITNLRSGLVLSSEYDSASENANVIQARYESLKGQVWNAKWDEKNGAIVLVNAKSGKPLDIAGGSTAAGANVRQHTANGTKAQSWHLSERKAPALTSLQRAVVSAAKNTASPGGGLCALWVTNVFDNAGIGHWEGDACDQYRWFCDDYNRASLRTGMIVAVSSHSHTWAGSIWGHVAVYIGNGMVMDNVGYVRTKKLSEWLAWYGDTVTPKWGWFGGRLLA